MSESGYRVGVVGATGAVGATILEVLAERGFPARDVVPLASAAPRSSVPYAGRVLEVRELNEDSIQGIEIALSSAGGKISAEWAPKLVEAGAVVVDNTSYWRMHEDVPLVVAGVNDEAVDAHKGIVASQNCTTMELMMALKPILAEAGIEPDRLHLPVGLRHRAQGDRGAALPVAGDPGRQGAARRSLPPPGRLQRAAAGRGVQGRRRLHHRGAQGDGGDAQDPLAGRRRGDLGDLCTGARDHRPFRVGQRPDARRALA